MYVNYFITLQVVEYDPDSDTWRDLGDMLESRFYTTVFEVPKTWCEEFQ